jgi:hypothetical protein
VTVQNFCYVSTYIYLCLDTHNIMKLARFAKTTYNLIRSELTFNYYLRFFIIDVRTSSLVHF